MILCISCNTPEYTTELVQDWIFYLGGQSVRFNGTDIIEKSRFSIQLNNESRLSIETESGLENFRYGWFRKWLTDDPEEATEADCEGYLSGDVSLLKRSEFTGIGNVFFQALAQKSWFDLPPVLRKYPTKVEQLQRAREVGLLIPATIITNNKADLFNFYDKLGNKSLIIKPIREMHAVQDNEGNVFSTYTADITACLGQLPDFFFPSQFQENIKKKFELRVFYFDKKCYTMAIFSSSDAQTKADFRNYNWKKPNRTVPYELPEAITNKIVELMESFRMNTGSLDFIVNEKDEYIFLEVNPTGQFGMVSFPCNYHLEKIVAQTLVEGETAKAFMPQL